MATTTALSSPEKKTLQQCEATIERGISCFMEVGRALLKIKEEKLFLEVSDTFEGYVKKRWGYTKQWAYQQIESMRAAEAVKGLEVTIKSDNGNTESTIVDSLNECQARELAKLKTDNQRAKALTEATKSVKIGNDGKPKVTAAAIRKAAAKFNPKPSAKPAEEETKEKSEPPVNGAQSKAELDHKDGKKLEAPCPNCIEHNRNVNWWRTDKDGTFCAFCGHPHGEPSDKDKISANATKPKISGGTSFDPQEIEAVIEAENKAKLPTWQEFAEIHKRAVNDLNRIRRELKGIVEKPEGVYFSAQIRRVDKYMEDAKAAIYQAEPIKVKGNTIITRQEGQSRKRA